MRSTRNDPGQKCYYLKLMNKIKQWEYHLRQFIDIATRWTIESIATDAKPPNNPFSGILWPYVQNARELFEGFSDEILMVPHYQGVRIMARFAPMIERYQQWYEQHEKEIRKAGFNEYNPYRNMLNVIESTRNLFTIYFPESQKNTDRSKDKGTGPTAGQVANNNTEPSKQQFDTLFEAFKDPEKYQRIMNLLVFKGYCNAGNYKWNEKKYNRTMLMALLDKLEIQGYLNRDLSSKEKVEICHNTFKIKVAIRFCSTKATEKNYPEIKLASTY